MGVGYERTLGTPSEKNFALILLEEKLRANSIQKRMSCILYV